MPTWREQVMIDASPEAIWELLGDPTRYPEWAGFDAVEITGIPEVEAGTEFEQTSRMPGAPGKLGLRESTVFRIEEIDELRSLRMRCTTSGWYSNWLLTPAQGGTFVDAEFGIDPTSIGYRLAFGALGTRHFRGTSKDWIDGLRTVLDRDAAATAGA